MKNMLASVFLAVFAFVGAATAQQSDVAWVQIEAHPSLREAQSRAQAYAGLLADVNGFALSGNWYAIALGPYQRDDAERVLRVYRAEGQIPRDSFLAFARDFGQQFWPVGAGNADAAAAPTPDAADDTTRQDAQIAPPAQPEPGEETPAEARRSEQLLTAEERRDLQIGLRAAGFYNSAIDGAFGAGTRRSMSDWQIANGYEATGVLTTLQRTVLMDQYNAPLISVGMARVSDKQAGIDLPMPLGAVKFARYEPPFAHYDSDSDLGARVLLISQTGNQATLSGLYDIMQTLEIVPLNGPRNRERERFTLEGRNSKIISHSEATLQDGQIKGFTLIWPTGDEDRRQRVLAEMQAGFTRLPGVLDADAGAAAQNIDLISGLEVRKPRVSRSGFYVDATGTVLTTADAVQGCGRITLDDRYEAKVATSDDALGVAVLRPLQPLAPIAIAQLRSDAPRLQSELAVSGYSYDGALGAPTLTFGTMADVKGLRGETELSRLALAATPGDAGGPVLDGSGAVVGMLLSASTPGRQLPRDVSLAANAAALRNVLELADIRPQDNADGAALKPDDLLRTATGMTVLVSCWD